MIIFALSYNMLLGQTGLLSFGHAVYFGLGGFVADPRDERHHPRQARRAGADHAARRRSGRPRLRLPVRLRLDESARGLVFAMISLGIGELVSSSSFILRSFFGGEEGITTNRAKLAPLFGHQVRAADRGLLSHRGLVPRLHRRDVRAHPHAVRANVQRSARQPRARAIHRLFAAAGALHRLQPAAFFAGIAGGLSAINFEIMNAQQLGAQQSGLVLLMTYIGGVGFFAGPIIGAVIVTFLQIILSDVTDVWQLYFGLLFIGVVLFAPGGVAGLADAPRGGGAPRRILAACALLRAWSRRRLAAGAAGRSC